jgi:hypothetical protein
MPVVVGSPSTFTEIYLHRIYFPPTRRRAQEEEEVEEEEVFVVCLFCVKRFFAVLV